MLTQHEAARLIDISCVRTHHGVSDIEEMVALCRRHRFFSAHVLPCWVRYLAERLRGFDEVIVGSPIGFPSGGHTVEVKKLEAKQLLRDGVQEMDLVMNIGKLKSGDYRYVLEEVKEIAGLAGDVPLKVIIEINCLTDEEIKKACELVLKSGAGFIKTGTGWLEGGPNVERIRTMMDFVGKGIKVKAAGGIRTVGDFVELHRIGVSRFGINVQSAQEIIEKLGNLS
jgi:deoxyribose-phosphate aldolase